jgi:hypothetical protein
MKTISIISAILIISVNMFAQLGDIKVTDVKHLDGNNISTSDIFETGQPVLLIFWQSNSNQCCANIESLHSAWSESLHERGVKMVAICVDCSGSWGHVKPIAVARDWDFEIFIDVNGDFKRAMGVNLVPCTILFDKDLKQICRHNGYCSGSGEMLCEKIEEHLK